MAVIKLASSNTKHSRFSRALKRFSFSEALNESTNLSSRDFTLIYVRRILFAKRLYESNDM